LKTNNPKFGPLLLNKSLALKKSARLEIFIIDDDMVAQFDTRIRVHQSGMPCDISCFEDAGEVLVKLEGPDSGEREFPDIIILDPDTPGFKGLGFLEELKGLVGRDLYPDVYLLSPNGPADRFGEREQGLVRDLLRKPISRESVAGILHRARERRENDSFVRTPVRTGRHVLFRITDKTVLQVLIL